MDNDKYVLIEFGLGGYIAHAEGGLSTLHGYETEPDRFFIPYHWWADPPEKLTHNVKPENAEGAMVLDKKPAILNGKGVRAAYAYPLVDVRLKKGDVEWCPDTAGSLMCSAMKSEPGNEFGRELRIHEAVKKVAPKAPGPLDSVDMWTFAAMWKAIGARIGRVKAGKIEWEA